MIEFESVHWQHTLILHIATYMYTMLTHVFFRTLNRKIIEGQQLRMLEFLWQTFIFSIRKLWGKRDPGSPRML